MIEAHSRAKLFGKNLYRRFLVVGPAWKLSFKLSFEKHHIDAFQPQSQHHISYSNIRSHVHHVFRIDITLSPSFTPSSFLFFLPVPMIFLSPPLSRQLPLSSSFSRQLLLSLQSHGISSTSCIIPTPLSAIKGHYFQHHHHRKNHLDLLCLSISPMTLSPQSVMLLFTCCVNKRVNYNSHCIAVHRLA